MVTNPATAKNPKMSGKQERFEKWASKRKLDLARNWYLLYHNAPYTYVELFGDVTPDNYYTNDKTQGAWDAWREK
jgi:hypothetical protein